MKMNKLTQNLKPVSLVLLLGMSSISIAAEMMDTPASMPTTAAIINSETSVVNTAPEIYSNEDWQTPVVTEFTKLDSSGNGLLLPNEASKGKTFNKKTFKQADTDNDGSIDVNEYVLFKTGKKPETAKPVKAPAEAAKPMPEKTMSEKVMPDAPTEVMPEEAH